MYASATRSSLYLIIAFTIAFWMWYAGSFRVARELFFRVRDIGHGSLLIIGFWLCTSLLGSVAATQWPDQTYLKLIEVGKIWNSYTITPFIEELWRLVIIASWLPFPLEAVFLSTIIFTFLHNGPFSDFMPVLATALLIVTSLALVILTLRFGFWAAFLLHAMCNSYRPIFNLTGLMDEPIFHYLYWAVFIGIGVILGIVAYKMCLSFGKEMELSSSKPTKSL